MGFFGRLRGLVLKTYKNGAYDLEAASKAIVNDAKSSVKGADISGFFTTKYMKDVGGVPHLGDAKLLDFVQFSREGNYAGSFGTAFRNNPALDNRAVRNTVDGLLNESRRTLPDFRVRQNIETLDAAGTLTGLNLKSLRSVSDLDAAVKANKVLGQKVDALLRRVNVTKTLKFLGFTVVFGAVGVIGYEAIYKKMERLAAENTGCFAYWYNNEKNIRKCKVVSYSCKTGSTTNDPCLSGVLPTSIIENKECLVSDNKNLNCLHCQNDDPKNSELPENVMLRCEERSAGEMLVEAITETIGNVWTGVTSGLSSIFMYGAILLVVIIVLVVIVNFLR
jgi:hypothetical protein